MKLIANILTVVCFLTFVSKVLSFAIEGRIAYGQNAEIYSAPYIISLQVPVGNGTYHHSCGGSILNEHWVLTAAHCLSDPERVKTQIIKAGRHNINAKSEFFAQTRKIQYYKNHVKYPGGVAPFDIALIYVNEPFEFNKSVKPIQLPKSGKNHTGIATLFGWGLLENHTFPNILQTADIPIISNQQCATTFKDLLVPSNICTVDQKGRGACSSDSGGPLVQLNKNTGKVEQIGVVSYGPPCGQPDGKSITVYVRVSHFIEWMAKVKQEYESTL